MKGVIAVIQARMGSTRLPGKVMLELEGHPVLWHVIQRLRASKQIDSVVIATTKESEDDVIDQFCIHNEVDCYRGSTDNVLSRYYEAAKMFEAKVIVRITSDCPLIDAQVVDKCIRVYHTNAIEYSETLYVSNRMTRTYPRGLDTEVFSFSVLEKTQIQATRKYEMEHVTPYVYEHPEYFRLINVSNEFDYSGYRWTLDTSEDFRLIQEIYKELYRDNGMFTFKDVLELFDIRPELREINAYVEQKDYRYNK